MRDQQELGNTVRYTLDNLAKSGLVQKMRVACGIPTEAHLWVDDKCHSAGCLLVKGLEQTARAV